ncbi:MAG: UxaA family hydrolase [Peptococcaceae bacterium]
MEKSGFPGYRRPDNQVGTRNFLGIIAAMDNANPVVRTLSRLLYGSLAVCPGFGRGQMGEDFKLHRRSVIGLGSNPNLGACLVISLEPDSAAEIAEGIRKTGKRAETLSLQDDGGFIGVLAKGLEIGQELILQITRQQREICYFSDLVLGVECGGSDATSGISANPAAGMVSDWIVEQGGTVIMSEPTEWIGAEHILVRRAKDEIVAAAIQKCAGKYISIAQEQGLELLKNNPTLDNIAGGLSTIEDKALGAIRKGGSKTIEGVLAYGEKPEGKGLYLMDAPAAAVENLTALAAGGANLMLFCTGRSNPIGFSIVPTIKISGNKKTIKNMSSDIDVDVSGIMGGTLTIESAQEKIIQRVVSVTAGQMTKNEILRNCEISISRIGQSI